MEIERKVCPTAELKMLDEGAGTLTGYASVFGVVDRVNERTRPGAFSNSLPGFVKDGFITWSHDWSQPVATVTDAVEDSTGLKITAEFHGTEAGQAARQWAKERLARGKSVGLSIGYRTLRSELADDMVTDLVELDLYEVAIVTVPCLPAAQATSAKSGIDLDTHSETVLATVREFSGRVKSLSGLRAKEGRALSESNRARLRSHVDALTACAKDLEDLLAATEKPKSVDPFEVEEAIARYAETMGRLAGVPLSA